MPTQNQRNNRNARPAGTRRSSTGGSTSRNSSGSPRRSAGSASRNSSGSPRRSTGSASRNQSATTRRSTGSSRSRNRRKYIIRQRVALLICAVLLCSIIGFAVYKLTRQDTPDNPQGPAQTSGSTGESTEPAAQPESTEAVTEPAPTTEAAGRLEELPRSYKLPVEAVLQNPELPSGCEITSLTCLLNYLGFDVSKTEMVKHLNITPNGGVSYYEYFVGSPYDPNSFGCFAPVIVKAAQSYLTSVGKESDYVVSDLSGSDPAELYRQVAQGNPVVVWGTMNMWEPIERVYWNLPDGTPEMWYTYEHCMVLSGYDLDTGKVEICDPQKGKVQYDQSIFETRYKQLQSQAVTVVPVGGAVPVTTEPAG